MPKYKPEKFRGRQAELDWSVEQVALAADVSDKTVIAIRKGRPVSSTSLEKVADALGLSMAEIYPPKPDEEPATAYVA